MQNIKVDIAYYMTSTDFEMEFNLCGCCRTRLLTDRSTDKKSFINIMSRAVSRSRVIIGCGKLFGDNGMISIVATAIGKETTIADKKEYGITAENEIPIIDGSIPLVTSEGYFGGCIIESGPQTIILLTENKTIRKNIMQNLIHPYVEELSLIPAENVADSVPDKAVGHTDEVSEEIAPETTVEITEEDNEEIETEPIEESEIAIQETENETNDETHIVDESVTSEELDISSGNDECIGQDETENDANTTVNTEDDSFNISFITDSHNDVNETYENPQYESYLDNLYIEKEKNEKKRDIRKRRSDYYIQSEEDSFILSHENDDENAGQKPIKKSHKSNIPIIIILAVLIIVVGVLIYILIITPMLRNETPSSYIQSLFNATVENKV